MTWFYQDFVKYYLSCRKRFSSARLLDSDDHDPALFLPTQAAFLLEKPELRIPILTNWQQVDFLSVDRRYEGSAGDINVIKRHGS